MIYSLFIERPRTGAAPVPYGPFLKTKLLTEAEAWVAAPVLSAKAAANVREGDAFTARYDDPKLRDEQGPLSRVAAFGKVIDGKIAVCTARGAAKALKVTWAQDWLMTENAEIMLEWAAAWNTPRQVLVMAACAAATPPASDAPKPQVAIVMAEAWAKGKASLADVERAADAAEIAADAAAAEVSKALRRDRTAYANFHAASKASHYANAAYFAVATVGDASRAHLAVYRPSGATATPDLADRIREILKLPDVCYTPPYASP